MYLDSNQRSTMKLFVNISDDNPELFSLESSIVDIPLCFKHAVDLYKIRALWIFIFEIILTSVL